MTELIQYIPLATAIVSAIAGWLMGRRKREADAASSEIANVSAVVNIWKQTAEDLRDQYITIKGDLSRLQEDYERLEDEHRKIMKENSTLRTRVRKLESENQRLQSKS
ncbi:MAG: hypothetical protein EP346_06970 [Bacteroidetes bacterium]|nr:MAG: hypothetical protein EP346_06970 [Bacteroidota bacterium]